MRTFIAVGALLLLAGAGCATKQVQNSQAISSCDVGSLCLQESKNEGGVFGVATIEAHYVGDKTFTVISDKATCPVMEIDSANDERVLEEVGADESGKYLFAISQDEVTRFRDATADAPVTLVTYIAERKGSDSSPCSPRVHIVN